MATTTGIGVFECVRARAYPELISPPFLSWGNNNSPAVKKDVNIPNETIMYFFRMGFLI
jgi:hypothetical protein